MDEDQEVTQAAGASPAGAATDSFGRATLDPTKNVLDLVDAAIKRQDDLREKDHKHLSDIIKLRADNLEEVARCNRDAQRELRLIETERINAIRTVDVDAVQRAAQVQAAQAQALATQVATSAEAMRAQVAAAATAAQTALQQSLGPIQKSIDDLRQAQYQAQGEKSQTSEAGGVSRDKAGLYIAAAVGSVGFLLGFASIVIALTQ